MNDEVILDLYFARDEQAVTETDRKYGRYCFSLAKKILPSQCDCEETVNDTYLRAWDTIPPKRPEVLRMYLAKITRNLAFSRWRSASARKRGGGTVEVVLEELSGCLAAPGGVEDHLNARELEAAIRSFLDGLPQRERNLFLRRYFFLEESADIGARYGMKTATVLRTLSRTREKLRVFLRKEGFCV